MMRKWQDNDEKPDTAKRGSYPPDVARRRRQLGLPVTPEEHEAYKHGASLRREES